MTTDTTAASPVDVPSPAGPALLTDDDVAAVGGGWQDVGCLELIWRIIRRAS
jgi:hypothetical protein